MLEVVAYALLVMACSQPPVSNPHIGVGQVAPSFTLEQSRGGMLNVAPEAGPVLLSFVCTCPQDDQAAKASRSQVVFIKSMAEQYAKRGIRFVLIETSASESAIRPNRNDLLNLSYDWDVDTIPLVADTASAATARNYGIRQLPTTLLIGEHGRVANRWDGFATAAQLGFSIEALLDASTQTTPLR